MQPTHWLASFLGLFQPFRTKRVYQGKTVKTQSNTVVVLAHVQFKSFNCHSREKMYQALSRITVLRVTGSWARAWEQGYILASFQALRPRMSLGYLLRACLHRSINQMGSAYYSIVPASPLMHDSLGTINMCILMFA